MLYDTYSVYYSSTNERTTSLGKPFNSAFVVNRSSIFAFSMEGKMISCNVGSKLIATS